MLGNFVIESIFTFFLFCFFCMCFGNYFHEEAKTCRIHFFQKQLSEQTIGVVFLKDYAIAKFFKLCFILFLGGGANRDRQLNSKIT